jgi:parallel beta-helix repeat protein
MVLKIFILNLILFFSVFSGCINDNNGLDDDNGNDLENNIKIKGKDTIYFSIMDAVNDCEDGDIVIVGKGIYKERISVYKSITLTGVNTEKTIIDADKSSHGIYIIADSVNINNFTIKNSGGISYNDAGIYIQSNKNRIVNNRLIDNKKYGIYVFNGSNNSIVDNFFSNNGYGLYAVGSYQDQINRLNISNNICLNNSELGIYLRNCVNSTIKNNVISDSNYGLHMQHSDENIISFNLFTKSNIGLYLCCGAEDNIIFKNNFLNNYEYHSKSNTENKFDYQGFGNFWDDYNGVDYNSDGIGDEAYIVFHNEDIDVYNQDSYPLIDMIR